jgi:hypothetical protein
MAYGPFKADPGHPGGREYDRHGMRRQELIEDPTALKQTMPWGVFCRMQNPIEVQEEQVRKFAGHLFPLVAKKS